MEEKHPKNVMGAGQFVYYSYAQITLTLKILRLVFTQSW